ncbi:aminotransferase class I/II-fold pyridoxal phosphate-dependent enzyme [Iamia sp. SCSIO 61187]|uniref:aminotransferase class I/II-fold pyridoxal phosphate-dependent enzyme n=1 Tax=Iamia sp. SCSIO 61187 TaxID=2722752 RepID=UPI001C62ADD2|nr:aminotransferase class I/II-fold pyridoxal phosphate-dependent enzyme [Iamia sp. SCSIO 61187]QYG91382.1 aminotransferase class I/II-fold pyridoxal phosphate-dependent enzyme [Iamia sp. SCSIO 61187]
MADGWAGRVDARLAEIRAAGRWRRVRPLDAHGPIGTTADGSRVTSFASNDYLGLSAHPAVVAAAHAALDRWGAGATASRLVVGSRPPHHDLEADLAAWKGTEAALVFPTGYAANVGVLTALAGPGTRILSDALNHASIVDGCRLARGELTVVPHADLDALAAALAADDRPTVVVADSVFSMDGDAADVDALAGLCARHGAALVLDEAHGVLGPDLDPGAHPDLLLVRVGTLSKALGALGGFVACSTAVRDLLVNVARPFIFTTALSPADAAAAHAALGVVRSPEGDALRARLRAHVDRLAPGHPSPIVPVVLGPEDAALATAEDLLAQGLLVPAIRPPTVPEGTSRLRVTFSAAHTDADVDRLLAALTPLRSRWHPSDEHPTPATEVGDGAAATGSRPATLVAVLGTGTEVGKTWVAARLLAALRVEGRTVAARKPAQSAEPDDPTPSDADELAAATGEDPLDVCPAHRRYARAMAPPMAAAALGRPGLTVADLAAEVTWPDGVDVGLVETAGGAASPAADDGDSLALVRAIGPDHVVLVADAGLGTINGIRLVVAAMAADRWPATVVLNRYDAGDPLHVANRAWLRTREGLDVVTDVEALAERIR